MSPLTVPSWMPPVTRTHPGLAAVTATTVLLHTFLGIDGIAGPHTSPAWRYLGGPDAVTILGYAHIAVAATLTVGAFTRWAVARGGYVASVALFALTGGLFLTAFTATLALAGQWTYMGAAGVFNLAFAAVAAAAGREPVVPGNYADPDLQPVQRRRPRLTATPAHPSRPVRVVHLPDHTGHPDHARPPAHTDHTPNTGHGRAFPPLQRTRAG